MSASDETLQVAGSVLTEELFLTLGDGTNVDLINFVVELNLYEDIFSPCLTGSAVIADSSNLIGELPITGVEFITIKYRTPTLEDTPSNIIEKSFQIYSIENRTLNNDRETFYTIAFISIEGFVDQVSTVTKSFTETTDKIAGKIFKDYISNDRRIDLPDKKTGLIIGDTPHASKIRYISNYWSPFKNMSFLGKRAKGASLNGADYFFFETNKSFYFISLEALINQQLASSLFDEYVVELQKDLIPRRQSGYTFYGNQFLPEMTRIENMKMPNTVDVLEGSIKGYHANSIRGYDLTTKRMTESTFDYRNEIEGFVQTDAGIPIPDIPRNPFVHSKFISYNTSLFDDYGVTDHLDLPEGHPAQYMTDRVHYRQAYINSFNNFKFEINIPGRTDIEVGALINLLYPSARSKVQDENSPDLVFDQYLSGTYLITAIKHKFMFGEHSIIAEVVKNGLQVSMGEKSD